MINKNGSEVLENDIATMHPLISWRSIAAGVLVSLFTMLGLLGLGMAMGGVGLDEDTSAQAAGVFSGIWFIASVIISLFVGSYFAARMSKFQTARIGSAQGVVIASLLIGFMVFQSVSMVGAIGSKVGTVIGKSVGIAAKGAQEASQSPGISSAVNNLSEEALAELNLKSEPSVVAQSVATRLINGNPESAKNYLAAQAGITPAEADTRIAQLKVEVDRRVEDAKVAAGNALQSAGWTLFFLVILGSASAIGGGALGSRANFRHPLSQEQSYARDSFQHA